MCATQSSVHTATTFLSSSLSLRVFSLLLFLSLLPPRYKVTYSSNHNFLCYQRFFFLFFFFFNFRIISKSILHNHSNSIPKLNYDRRKWANTFLFFFFSSCLFFSWGWVVLLLFFFFFFPFHAFFFSFFLFFFFSFGVALFFFSFRCWTFLLFFSGGYRICSSCFWSLFLVSYFLGPCVFSLSPSIAWTSRSEIDSSLFLAATLIISVEPW